MTWVETAAWWIGAAWLFVGAAFAVVTTFGIAIRALSMVLSIYLRRAGLMKDCVNWMVKEFQRKRTLRDIASGAETQESN